MTRNTTPCSAMQELKQKLNFIADLIIDKNDVVYLDYPFHLNVGDLLIYHGTEEFFKQHNIQVCNYHYYDDCGCFFNLDNSIRRV